MPIPYPKPPFKNPQAVGSGFGRFFYGVDNTVYFSQVLITSKDAGKCYQNNDPTSDEISDLLATDGGVIPLRGAIKIRAFQEFRLGILVFCDNGVWYIYGGDGGFSASSYNISKVTDRGISSDFRSVVSAEGNVFYFSDNGIMQVVANEFDNLDAQDITEASIKTHYVENYLNRDCFGSYNSLDKEIWWVNRDGKMLVLDMVLQAFYPQDCADTTKGFSNSFNVQGEFYYTNYANTGNSLVYNFSQLTDRTFKDFGIDQTAYLVSGYETLGKFSNKKSVAEAMFFFEKTEGQILSYTDGAYVFDYPSSCLFQSRWDFDNSNAYAKWVGRTTNESGRGKAVELYKPLQRGFLPDAYPYTFDTGEGLISKKVNLRGNGKAVQFRFEAQAEKDLRLLGYNVKYTLKGSM